MTSATDFSSPNGLLCSMMFWHICLCLGSAKPLLTRSALQSSMMSTIFTFEGHLLTQSAQVVQVYMLLTTDSSGFSCPTEMP